MIVSVIAGFYGLVCLPAYVIAERSRVRGPGVAFVPFVGQTLALLRSMGRSGWLVLLTFIPLLNFAFWIWLMFALPSYHRRSLLWGLVLLVPVLGMYPYAFTLPLSPPRGRQTFTAVTR
jgi:hypothetical protein